MKYLPWLIVALVVGGLVLYLAGSAKLPFPGQGSLDARGGDDRNRAPPPDVDPDSALARDIGAATSAAFKLANTWFKTSSTHH